MKMQWNYAQKHDLVFLSGNKSLRKPRASSCYTDMCQSRLRFKSMLKHCQRKEDSLLFVLLFVLKILNYAFCLLLKITFVHTIISLVLRSNIRLICAFIQ